MTSDLISVVVPTRDRATWLALTLRTILAQQAATFEVIVVDDGSTDNTADVVARLDDSRLRLVRHATARGVSAARNRGLEEARGDWVGFCDDDDLWAPEKLSLQLRAAKSQDREWVYGGAVLIDDQQRIRGGSAPLPPASLVSELSRWQPMPGGCSNVVVARRALRETGPFSSEFGTLADWDLWLRLAARGVPACVMRPLVAYRLHASNMSLDVRRTYAELGLLERRHGIKVDYTRIDRHLANQCLRTGHKLEAFKLLARAALIDRSGYGTAELRADMTMVWRFAEAGAGRRLPSLFGWLQRRRHIRDRRVDQNLMWKAEADAWLGSLRSGRVDAVNSAI